MTETETTVNLPPGWYDWEWYYEQAVADAPPGSTLVEVGVFLGRSLTHLAWLAKAADKGLRVVGVDSFRGSPEFDGVVWSRDEGTGEDTRFSETPPGVLAGHCLWH